MKTQKFPFVLTIIPALAGLFIACTFTTDTVVPKGEIKTETRDVPEFSKINLGIAADVWYTQESTQKLVLEGDANLLEKIKTEVSNGKLKISSNAFNWPSREKVKIYISSSQLEEIGLSGSGNFTADQTVSGDNFNAYVSGSGNISMAKLQAKYMDASISGSGNITIKGPAEGEKLHASISGSGNISIDEFTAKEGEIAISGSGDCHVSVSSKLFARISGSGNIYYRGKPVLDAKVSGSGSIKAQ